MTLPNLNLGQIFMWDGASNEQFDQILYEMKWNGVLGLFCAHCLG